MNRKRLFTNIWKGIGPLLFTTAIMACSSGGQYTPDDPDIPDPTPADTVSRQTVDIITRMEVAAATSNVQAGLFMVNYLNDAPDELLPTGNYVHNQLLNWKNGTWTTASPIYWYDSKTPADFYAYAPYQSTVSNARQMTFAVKTEQNSTSAYNQSDFLWGITQGQSSSAGTLSLTLSHQFSQLTVVVTAENGFSEGELKAEDLSVTIGGTKPSAQIDLSTGMAEAIGQVQEINCLNNGDLTFQAILVPQQVPYSNFIQVNWKGNKYNLQNSFQLETHRQYTITVKLKKTQSGFDIGIDGWDIIEEDFGGVVGG